ncbi:TonB-dependent receptor [Sporomusa termitida]|uniref:Ferrichrome receptor FcuA n=1 Tax=Sporomusa termitida TaxID=2377 RepID=A0A517DP93_9FIRM|nr:TonB-dependent siderophore receptor [Sporomusa termitida]QDR79181.1 Ferrichrome receptor FcuA [Sporomusa termitida]
MKKKLSPARKRLLYALIGSSLFWHTPVTYAEDTAATAAAAGETDSKPDSAAQREFTLEKIEVTAGRDTLPPPYAGGQVARGGNVGILGNRDFMDTPFSITSYTVQTMEDQQASTLYDVLSNDSSIRFTTSNGHFVENYKIRGFDVSYQHLYFNGMQGLAHFDHIPVEFLERVEVLKGPSSFLYGGVNTSVGGAINLVPKRAGEEDFASFTADYTSSSQLGGHLDLGRRFGKNKEFGVRFNGVYADGDTETDGQSKKRQLGALGLDYRHDRWRLSLDAFSSEESFDNGSVAMYGLAGGYVKAPDASANPFPGIYGKGRNNGFLFKSEYDVSDNVTAYASMGKLANRGTGFLSGTNVVGFKSNGDGTISMLKQNWWQDSVAAELGLRGNYRTGAVNHQLAVGYNAMDTESAFAWNRITGIATNIYNPTSLASYLAALPTPSKSAKTSETNLSSLFIADTLAFNEEKVQLTLGVRQQNVKTKSFNATTGAVTAKYDEDATTPAIGLVVKPWAAPVSLYANYIEGLSPGSEVTDTEADNYGEVFAPYKSKQYEIGAKWDRGTFANTLSFYQIEKPSVITLTRSDGKKIVSDDAEQRNRGIEWNAFGAINDKVRLLGGIAYTRAEYTRDVSTKQGNTPWGVPKYQANLGVEWDTPWNPDLTLSVRAIFSNSQYVDSANTVKIPSWVRYDIGTKYKTVINKVPVTFRASVENVFDRNYWSGLFADGYATAGGPRAFKLSASMQL